MFNLLILVMLDVKRDGSPISAVAHQGHVFTAAFGILPLGLVAISILVPDLLPTLGWIGPYSPVLLSVYAVAVWAICHYERNRVAGFVSGAVEGPQYAHVSAPASYARFVLHAAIIVAAATYPPHLGDEIAGITGLGGTFVGSIFIALSTSLPDVVMSRAALKLGAVDLAVGNVLGSNLFNMAILAIEDAFFTKGPFLASISPSHAITAIAAMAMTAVITIALTFRSRTRVLLTSWGSVGAVLIYVLTSLLLYARR